MAIRSTHLTLSSWPCPSLMFPPLVGVSLWTEKTRFQTAAGTMGLLGARHPSVQALPATLGLPHPVPGWALQAPHLLPGVDQATHHRGRRN